MSYYMTKCSTVATSSYYIFTSVCVLYQEFIIYIYIYELLTIPILIFRNLRQIVTKKASANSTSNKLYVGRLTYTQVYCCDQDLIIHHDTKNKLTKNKGC